MKVFSEKIFGSIFPLLLLFRYRSPQLPQIFLLKEFLFSTRTFWFDVGFFVE